MVWNRGTTHLSRLCSGRQSARSSASARRTSRLSRPRHSATSVDDQRRRVCHNHTPDSGHTYHRTGRTTAADTSYSVAEEMLEQSAWEHSNLGGSLIYLNRTTYCQSSEETRKLVPGDISLDVGPTNKRSRGPKRARTDRLRTHRNLSIRDSRSPQSHT